jgi:hypothetical protein
MSRGAWKQPPLPEKGDVASKEWAALEADGYRCPTCPAKIQVTDTVSPRHEAWCLRKARLDAMRRAAAA